MVISNANDINHENTCTNTPEPLNASVVPLPQLFQPPHPRPEFAAPDIERRLLLFDRERRRDMMWGEWQQQGRRRCGLARRWMEAEGVEGLALRVGT